MSYRLFWHKNGFLAENILLFCVCTLAALGWVMVTSASIEIGYEKFHDSLYFFKRHGLYLILALMAAVVSYHIPLSIWQSQHRWLLGLSLVLLMIVFLPGLGYEVNGSRRWLNLGLVRLQVSEFSKVAFIVYWASVISFMRQKQIWSWSRVAEPFALVAFASSLILMQPDFGAVFVLVMLSVALLFLAGVKLFPFLLVGLIAVVCVSLMVILVPYRWARMMSFLDPWSDPFSGSYQLTQSLIAFGRGGLWGTGLGESVQKNFYLPEGHTDFIFAVLCEELGLFGGLAVLLLFLILIGTIFIIGHQAQRFGRFFGAYLCYGTAVLLAIQMSVSMGVNTGLLPTKGLTLPLVSYGGTSLLVTFVLLGLVFRVQYENRQRLGWPRAYVKSTYESMVRQS